VSADKDTSVEMDNSGKNSAAMLDSLLTSGFDEHAERDADTASINDDGEIREDGESGGSSGTKAEQAAKALELEIKAAKGMHKFKLDPNDPDLIDTLQKGVGAKQAFTKAAQLEKKLKEYEAKLADVEPARGKATVMDEITSLIEKGYTSQAVKALLGDKYDDFRRKEIVSHVDYESASPDERYQLDLQRKEQEKSWMEHQKTQEADKLRQELNALKEQAVEEKWHGVATRLFSKYSLDGFIKDPVRAQEANEMLWEGVFNFMEKHYPDMDNWSPSLLDKVFRKKAAVLRGGMEQQVEDRLVQATEQKKTAAKEQAQLIARKNYSSDDDIMGKVKNSKSALDRLNILSRR
jgi:hypothetical protein